jgi:asparagine N-glycosylation enzyme membrane subunit Stt3
MFAVDQMDPTVQGIFFLVAVILFAVAAIGGALKSEVPGWFVAAGLACFGVPFMWNAFAAS